MRVLVELKGRESSHPKFLKLAQNRRTGILATVKLRLQDMLLIEYDWKGRVCQTYVFEDEVIYQAELPFGESVYD